MVFLSLQITIIYKNKMQRIPFQSVTLASSFCARETNLLFFS